MVTTQADVIDDSEVEVYLAELSTYSLERLQKEPDLLRVEAKRHENSIEKLACEHYHGFVAAAETIHNVNGMAVDMAGSLRSIGNTLPKLSNGCDTFATEAHQIAKERKTNRLMLTHHKELVELLEVPQLMDTLVRNGFYEQALELQSFALNLGRLHQKLPIVQSIVEEVNQTAKAMRLQLLQLLQSDVQLAVCLRAVGYLRRLEDNTEEELRTCFLECRDKWLQEMLADIPDDNASTYLVKLADQHRVHLFDIITQYHSIFGDELDTKPQGGGFLSHWVRIRIETFVHNIESMLPQVVDSALLSNVLKQCMYCGLSLSRVGADFRVLLLPIFSRHILELLQGNLDALQQHFEAALDGFDWVAASRVQARSVEDATEQVANMAPLELLEHAPLAAATNYLLMCFNDLRQCTPYALKDDMVVALDACLGSLADTTIKAVEHLDERMLDRPKSADSMLRVMSGLALPYISQCFDCIAGDQDCLHLSIVQERLDATITPVADPESQTAAIESSAAPPSTSHPSATPAAPPAVQALSTNAATPAAVPPAYAAPLVVPPAYTAPPAVPLAAPPAHAAPAVNISSHKAPPAVPPVYSAPPPGPQQASAGPPTLYRPPPSAASAAAVKRSAPPPPPPPPVSK